MEPQTFPVLRKPHSLAGNEPHLLLQPWTLLHLYSFCPLDTHNLDPTINIGWDLPKDGEVRVIDNPTEDPVHAALIVDENGLLGHSEGHHPHRQEKEEEEDILHL